MHENTALGRNIPRHPEWYTRAMERLVSVVQELSLARSVAAVQDIVRHAARELAGADGATFVLREGGFCHYADEDAIAPLWKGQRFPMKTCISGWAMLNRHPAIIEDIYSDARIPHDAYRPTFVKSLAMVPIRASDPIGAIGVYWAKRHQPGIEEVRLIQALADTTAVAMENVTIHAELEQRVRDRTAEALAAKDEAERANTAKSRFFAAASHDLRQPLQAIGLMTRSLAKCLDSPPRAQRILQDLQGPLGSINDILDELQDIHKLDAGAIEPAIGEFPIQTLLERARINTEPLAIDKQLRLRSVPCSAQVRSDPVLLERIVRNFLINATCYTESGRVLVGCRRWGAKLRIEVWDTGIGIAASDLNAVFEEYRQIRVAGQRHLAKGMGLGLSIAKRLATLLGHELDVRSLPGKGSMFAVIVPLAETGACASASRADTQARKHETLPVSVLLIEDDPAVADSMQLFLGLEGFSLVTAENGKEALARTAAAPDIIISDYHLGSGETGPDVIDMIRKRFQRQIPAVVLTGDATVVELPSQRSRLRLLHKPVDPDILVTVLRETLSAMTVN